MNNYHVLTMGGLRLLEPSGLHKWGAAYEGRDERSRGGGRRGDVRPVYHHRYNRVHTSQELPLPYSGWIHKYAAVCTGGICFTSGDVVRGRHGKRRTFCGWPHHRDNRFRLHDKCHCVLVMPEAAL